VRILSQIAFPVHIALLVVLYHFMKLHDLLQLERRLNNPFGTLEKKI